VLPTKHVVDGVKVGQSHSTSRGVTSQRCELSSKFFDYLTAIHFMITPQPLETLYHPEKSEISAVTMIF